MGFIGEWRRIRIISFYPLLVHKIQKTTLDDKTKNPCIRKKKKVAINFCIFFF